MNIASALKEKNRIAGRIRDLQVKVQRYNRYEVARPPAFNAATLLESLQIEWAFLSALKVRIAKANVGIADKLVALSEAKAELAFWTGFNSAGQATELVDARQYIDGQYVETVKTFTSCVTIEEVDAHKNRVQKLIEDLQDEVDAYNATTQV